MVAIAVGLDRTQCATKFSDVPKSSPNSEYIQSAVDAGIIERFPDGNEKVIRGHIAAFIARAFQLPVGTKMFKDVAKGHIASIPCQATSGSSFYTHISEEKTNHDTIPFVFRAIKYVTGFFIHKKDPQANKLESL